MVARETGGWRAFGAGIEVETLVNVPDLKRAPTIPSQILPSLFRVTKRDTS